MKEIHKTNGRFLKTNFYRKLVSGAVHNIFSTIDPKFHAEHRRLLASPISDSSLTRLEPSIADRVGLTIRRMAEEQDARGAIDVFKWWLFMTSDIIGELSFGESFGMLESGKVREDGWNKQGYTDGDRKTNIFSTWRACHPLELS